jgi:hypothetical protein
LSNKNYFAIKCEPHNNSHKKITTSVY